MKIVVLVCLVLILILVVSLFLPIKMSTKIYFNLTKNIGVYCFEVLGLKVLCGRIKLAANGVVVENQKHRFQGDEKVTKTMTKFSSNIIKKMDVLFFDLFVSCGVQKRPDITAMVGGGVDSIVATIFAYMKNKNIPCRRNIDTKFEQNAFDVAVDAAVCITMFDILLSLIEVKKRSVKNER